MFGPCRQFCEGSHVSATYEASSHSPFVFQFLFSISSIKTQTPKIEIPNLRKHLSSFSNSHGDPTPPVTAMWYSLLFFTPPRARRWGARFRRWQTHRGSRMLFLLRFGREFGAKLFICLLIHFSSHSSWEIWESQNQATKTKFNKKKKKRKKKQYLGSPLSHSISPALYRSSLTHSSLCALYLFFPSGARTLCRCRLNFGCGVYLYLLTHEFNIMQM